MPFLLLFVLAVLAKKLVWGRQSGGWSPGSTDFDLFQVGSVLAPSLASGALALFSGISRALCCFVFHYPETPDQAVGHDGQNPGG